MQISWALFFIGDGQQGDIGVMRNIGFPFYFSEQAGSGQGPAACRA